MTANRQTPWAYLKRYCLFTRTEYGWTADGMSEAAKTELVECLDVLLIKHDRAAAWASTPPKVRQVIRMDLGGGDDTKKLRRDASEANIFKALEKVLVRKAPEIAQNVVQELCHREKTIVWCVTRESVEIMTDAIEKACKKKDVRRLLEKNATEIWAVHGEVSDKHRNQVAADYRDHNGSAVIISTIQSMTESISLFGASSEHVAQLHYNPGMMHQAENRPYLQGTERLHIFYYEAIDTIDERMSRIVIPKLEVLDKISGSKESGDLMKHLQRMKEASQAVLDDFIQQLLAGVTDNANPDLENDDDGDLPLTD